MALKLGRVILCFYPISLKIYLPMHSKAIWGRLYKAKSAMEKGTLYQLKNVIGRSSVPQDPENDMNAAEDFLLLIVHAHVFAAARLLVQKDPTLTDSITSLAELVISSFVQLPAMYSTAATDNADGVQAYAMEVLTLGLLWYGFYDAIKEGDGDRVLRYWRFLLIIFKGTNHRNYAKEAVNLLYHYHYLLSNRQKKQFLWSRFINTKGGTGNNIPCDLHMEHLNRRLKSVLHGMGSNISPGRIQRAGQSIQVVQRVCDSFEKQTARRVHTDNHPYPAFGKDFEAVLKVLLDEHSFEKIEKRKYQTFKLTKSLLQTYKWSQLENRVQANLDQFQ